MDSTRHGQWAAPNAAASPPFATSPLARSSSAVRALLQVLCITSSGVARPSARTRLLSIHLDRRGASTSTAPRPRATRPFVPPHALAEDAFDSKRGVATCPGNQHEDRRHRQALAILVRDGVVRMDRDCAPLPRAVGAAVLRPSPIESCAVHTLRISDSSACEPRGGRGLRALALTAAHRRTIRDRRRLDLTAIGCGGAGASPEQSPARGVQWRDSRDGAHLARRAGHLWQAGGGLLGQRRRPERLFSLPLAAEVGP